VIYRLDEKGDAFAARKARTLMIPLEPMQSRLITREILPWVAQRKGGELVNGGWHMIRFDGPTGMMVTAMAGTLNRAGDDVGSNALLHPAELIGGPLAQVLMPEISQRPAPWGEDTPYHRYRGKKDCRYLKEVILAAVRHAAKSVYHAFPDRRDRTFEARDCTPLSGPCAGHDGAHSGLDQMDHSYYTYTANHTEGAPDAVEVVRDGSVVQNRLDWERNLFFWSSMKSMFPELIVRVHQSIKDYIQRKTGKTYLWIWGDENAAWHHWRHAHIDFKFGEDDSPNFSLIVTE